MRNTIIHEPSQAAQFIESDVSEKGGYKILGKLKAPFFDLNKPTRNNNDYSEAASAALESEEFRERIDNRVFFGRLGHPMTEDESIEDPAVRACVIMTDFSKNTKTNMYEGVLEILDNQYGHQLKSLIDAGCRMGVSTRGQGESHESYEGSNVITKGTYNFEALDVVTMPAVKEARVTVMESLDNSKRRSIEDAINTYSDRYVLESLRTTLEATAMPNKKALIEAIDKKLSAGEVRTTESMVGDILMLTGKLSTTEGLLREAKTRITELESTKTIGDDTKYKESVGKYVTLLRTATQTIESMKKNVSSLSSRLESKSTEFAQLNSRAEGISNKVRSISEDLEKVKSENESLIATNKSLTEELAKQKSLNESLETKLKEANSKPTKLAENLDKAKSDKMIESLNTKLKTSTEKCEQLQTNCNELRSKFIEATAKSYRVSVSELKSKVTADMSTNMIESVAKSIRTSMDEKMMALPDITEFGKVVNLSESVNSGNPEIDRAGRMAKMVAQN